MESDSYSSVAVTFLVLSLFAVYSFFVLAFQAISHSRSAHLEDPQLAHLRGVRRARSILDREDYFLFVAQLGAHFCAVTLLSLLGYIFFTNVLSEEVAAWHRYIGGILVFLGVVGGAFVYSQFLKSVVPHNPAVVLCRVAAPLEAAEFVLRPFVHLLRWILKVGLRPWGIRLPGEREEAASSEEISEMVEESSEAGLIEENEGEMIQGVIHFSDLVVQEVMTPRKDVVAVPESASLEEVVDLLARERFSRVLVSGSDLDDVRGVLVSKDLLTWTGKPGADFDLKQIMREAYSVSNTKRVKELFQELRRTGTHMAVVLDEHGGVDGVVTIEDLIEEIVGDIFDEYDSPEEEVSWRRTPSGDLLVSGSAVIDDLNDSQELNLPSGDYNTIAGFVINLLGRIPAVGEVIDFNGYKVKIERVHRNRIVRLRIVHAPTPNEAQE
ncbi:MAG: HlyC/CorC family transporter [Deltaproteobacteria bacterium]|nr:HlyC/CorC family transporter [Deltaproteobacteria bacterium]